MAAPPLIAGAAKLMLTLALPGVPIKVVGAPGTVIVVPVPVEVGVEIVLEPPPQAASVIAKIGARAECLKLHMINLQNNVEVVKNA